MPFGVVRCMISETPDQAGIIRKWIIVRLTGCGHNKSEYDIIMLRQCPDFCTLWKEGEIMATIPKDPVMLMSYLNTQLRDFYSSLDELCSTLQLERSEIEERLKAIDYYYDEKRNQFV